MDTAWLPKGSVGKNFKGTNLLLLIFCIFPKTPVPEKAVEAVLLSFLPFLRLFFHLTKEKCAFTHTALSSLLSQSKYNCSLHVFSDLHIFLLGQNMVLGMSILVFVEYSVNVYI